MATKSETRYAAERLRRLIVAEIDAVTEAVEGDIDLAHRLRVGVKRIRAWLRLLRPALGEERFGYENLVFRNLSRPFAAERERDALKATVGGLKDLDSRIRQDLDALVATHIRLADGDQERRHVLEVLAMARERLEAMELPAENVLEALERLYRRSRRAYDKARRLGSTSCLHEWRKQAKYLRYGLEALSDDLPGAGTARRRLKALGDGLGEDHDLAQLTAIAGENNLQAEVRTLIGRRREALQDKALKIGRKLYRAGAGRTVARFRTS